MSDQSPPTPGMRTLAALAPALELIRTQLDHEATLRPDDVDAWREVDATGHMLRLFGLVDGIRELPEVSLGDIREVVGAAVVAGLMVLTQLPPDPERPSPSAIVTPTKH